MGSSGEVVIITCSIVVTLCSTVWSYRGYFIAPSIDWTVEKLNLRIILAAPLLSVLCGIALLNIEYELVSECFLSIFEGYALFIFFCQMVLHVGSKADVITFLDQQPKPLEWRICNCLVLKRFKDGNGCFHFLAVSVLQYMFIKPILVLLLFISVRETTDESAAADRILKNLQAVTKTLSLVSLIVALAALLQFYRCLHSALHSTLHSFRWLPQRFLCIKLLVFLVTVQKIVMSIAFSEFPSDPRDEASEAVHVYLLILLVEAPFYAFLLNRYFGWNSVGASSSKTSDRPGVARALCDVLSFQRLLPAYQREISSSDSTRTRSSEDSSLVHVRSHQTVEVDRGIEMTTGPLHSSK